jgi:hypothetical protein
MGRERGNLVQADAQEARDVSRGAVSEPDPNHLRRKAVQDTQSVEILVLRDENEALCGSMRPNSGIG